MMKGKDMVNNQFLVVLLSHVLFLSSHALSPVITLKGNVFLNSNTTVYQVECYTNFRFWGCTVEFHVNGRTYEDLRLSGETCYNRLGICVPNICSCSDTCNVFKWTLPDEVRMENTLIACDGRIEANDKYYKAYSSVLLTRNGFINLERNVTLINSSTHPLKTTVSPSTNKPINYTPTLATMTFFIAVIALLLLILVIGWLYRNFYKPKDIKFTDKCTLSRKAKQYEDTSCNEKELEPQAIRNGTDNQDKKLSDSDQLGSNTTREVIGFNHNISDMDEIQSESARRVSEIKLGDLPDLSGQPTKKMTKRQNSDLDDSEKRPAKKIPKNEQYISDSDDFKRPTKRKTTKNKNKWGRDNTVETNLGSHQTRETRNEKKSHSGNHDQQQNVQELHTTNSTINSTQSLIDNGSSSG